MVEMIQSITKTYKKKLLYIMKQIFVPSNENKETYFMISPTLTMEMLLSYQDEVKKNINSIYTNCERLFIEALLLYEKHCLFINNDVLYKKAELYMNSIVFYLL